MSPVVLILIVIVAVALPLTAVFVAVRQIQTQRAAAARDRFPTARLIVPGANSYGRESLGAMQMRGNGTLVVTDAELYFEQWLPRKEIRIPLEAIQAVEMPSSFLGKTNFRPLLKVVFQTAPGQTDSIAWLVPDVEAVKRLLEKQPPVS